MENKFIYCFDENLKEKLIKKNLYLICEQIIHDEKVWIFENNNRITFSDDELSDIVMTNRLYFN